MIELVTRDIDQDIADQLQPYNVLIPHSAEVLVYLLQYPDIAAVVVPACAIVRQHVGVEPRIALERYRDPEDGNTHLMLTVRGEQYDDEFMRALKSASDEVARLMAGKAGWLLVYTDFRSPS